MKRYPFRLNGMSRSQFSFDILDVGTKWTIVHDACKSDDVGDDIPTINEVSSSDVVQIVDQDGNPTKRFFRYVNQQWYYAYCK